MGQSCSCRGALWHCRFQGQVEKYTLYIASVCEWSLNCCATYEHSAGLRSWAELCSELEY